MAYLCWKCSKTATNQILAKVKVVHLGFGDSSHRHWATYTHTPDKLITILAILSSWHRWWWELSSVSVTVVYCWLTCRHTLLCRFVSRLAVDGANTQNHEANWRPRHWSVASCCSLIITVLVEAVQAAGMVWLSGLLSDDILYKLPSLSDPNGHTLTSQAESNEMWSVLTRQIFIYRFQFK